MQRYRLSKLVSANQQLVVAINYLSTLSISMHYPSNWCHALITLITVFLVTLLFLVLLPAKIYNN